MKPLEVCKAFLEAIAPPADRAGDGAAAAPGARVCTEGSPDQGAPLGLFLSSGVHLSTSDTTPPFPIPSRIMLPPRFCSSHSAVSQPFPPGPRPSPSCSSTLRDYFLPPAPVVPCTASPGSWRWEKPQGTSTLFLPCFPALCTSQGPKRVRTPHSGKHHLSV